jgi:hypothetical protein
MVGEQSDASSTNYKASEKPWENVRNLDELITQEERNAILRAKGEVKKECQYIDRYGNWFYYCTRGLPASIRSAERIPHIYVRHVGPPKLSSCCFNAIETCIFLTDKEVFPNPAEIF